MTEYEWGSCSTYALKTDVFTEVYSNHKLEQQMVYYHYVIN